MKLSVVIAASNNASLLEQCLASLRGQGEAADIEVIVVSNYNAGTQEMIEKQFPQVKHISLPEDTTVPELRAMGISYSRGEIMALAEDHCVFDENWCSEIKKAHELPYSVIGGSVENASCERSLDWAVYFYEYGKYMLPNQADVVDSLPGNNVSYKRCVLEEIDGSLRKGFFETFIHWELRRQGYSLYLIPSAIVYHKKSYKAKETFIQCYHHGRSFAGLRVSDASLLKRIEFILGSLILPFLLPLRIVLRAIRKGRHIRELFLSLPYLLLLMVGWSFGEFCGYVGGEGRSSRKWK
ncbi:MAG: glycosyltransferase family 2 protein [Nitrososphaeraceae archaeon]